MEIKKAINECVLGKIDADDLPAIAVRALVDGHDSPSLRQLAGAQGSGNQELRALFAKALEELGFSTPSRAEAGLAAARSIAEDVLSGRITPYAGAKRIWVEVYTPLPELSQLRPFVGFASEYEDDEKHRYEYSNMIVSECTALLSG